MSAINELKRMTREGTTVTETAESNVGIELPSVTSADSGKVLSVNSSGAWVASEPSGGGGASGMLVTVTQSGDTFTADKTFAEIATALEDGIQVYVKLVQTSTRSHYFALCTYSKNSVLIFTCINDDGTYAVLMTFVITANNEYALMYRRFVFSEDGEGDSGSVNQA